MFSLICAWINGGINNREAGDLRRHRAHYDVIVVNNREAGDLRRHRAHYDVIVMLPEAVLICIPLDREHVSIKFHLQFKTFIQEN